MKENDNHPIGTDQSKLPQVNHSHEELLTKAREHQRTILKSKLQHEIETVRDVLKISFLNIWKQRRSWRAIGVVSIYLTLISIFSPFTVILFEAISNVTTPPYTWLLLAGIPITGYMIRVVRNGIFNETRIARFTNYKRIFLTGLEVVLLTIVMLVFLDTIFELLIGGYLTIISDMSPIIGENKIQPILRFLTHIVGSYFYLSLIAIYAQRRRLMDLIRFKIFISIIWHPAFIFVLLFDMILLELALRIFDIVVGLLISSLISSFIPINIILYFLYLIIFVYLLISSSYLLGITWRKIAKRKKQDLQFDDTVQLRLDVFH
ncbi:DUF4013 domain-containing protein [Haladaptatus sp. NG-WS-4]